MTRWADDDIAGRLIREQPDVWDVIRLPAVATPGDPLGRTEGQPLCPERYSLDALEAIKLSIGSRKWDALYQQSPQAYGAGRVYDRFGPANVDDALSLRSDLPLHVSMDFNVSPGMHAIVGQYDEVADQFSAVHEIHSPGMSVRGAMAELLRYLRDKGAVASKPLPWPSLEIFGDASGSSRWAGTAESCYDIVRASLASANLAFRVRHLAANPPIRERVDTFNEALCDVTGARHYRAHPQCRRLIEDFSRLKAGLDGLPDKSETALSHASDAEGYRVHMLRPLWRGAQGTKPGGRFSVIVGGR
jgi:hypothetical protein